MQYPTHDFTRPQAVEKLRAIAAYPPGIMGGRLIPRMEQFGSAIATSVIGGFELLIAPAVLERLLPPLVRHLAHERRVFDQPNGFVSRVMATPGDEPVMLCYRRDGYALAVWLDGDEAPPILYLDEPVPVEPPARLVEDVTREILTPVQTERPAPRATPSSGEKWRTVAAVTGAFVASMVLLELGQRLRMASVMVCGAAFLLVAAAAVVALVRGKLP